MGEQEIEDRIISAREYADVLNNDGDWYPTKSRWVKDLQRDWELGVYTTGRALRILREFVISPYSSTFRRNYRRMDINATFEEGCFDKVAAEMEEILRFDFLINKPEGGMLKR